MNPIRKSAPAIAGSLVLALTLGGCVVSGPRVAVEPVRIGWATPVVVTAPPAAIVEVQGVAPQPGYVWVNGYWNWVGGRHVWVPGRWEAHRPGYAWAPHQWHREGNGWRMAPGHWERR